MNNRSIIQKIIYKLFISKREKRSLQDEIAFFVLKFTLSIFAALAFISIIFPDDGISFFGTKLEFPSLSEVFEIPVDSTANEESPQEVIEKRKSSLDIAKENEFKTFCETNPARFHMPNDDITYLDPFFKALDG